MLLHLLNVVLALLWLLPCLAGAAPSPYNPRHPGLAKRAPHYSVVDVDGGPASASARQSTSVQTVVAVVTETDLVTSRVVETVIQYTTEAILKPLQQTTTSTSTSTTSTTAATPTPASTIIQYVAVTPIPVPRRTFTLAPRPTSSASATAEHCASRNSSRPIILVPFPSMSRPGVDLASVIASTTSSSSSSSSSTSSEAVSSSSSQTYDDGLWHATPPPASSMTASLTRQELQTSQSLTSVVSSTTLSSDVSTPTTSTPTTSTADAVHVP